MVKPELETWKWSLFLVPLFLGSISTKFAPINNTFSEYPKKGLKQLSNSIPNKWVFFIMWTILYLLLGLAWILTISHWEYSKEYNINTSDNWLTADDNYIMCYVFYPLTIIGLFAWPFVFKKSKKASLYLLFFILILTLICMMISPISANIALSPLIVWEFFAFILNFLIVLKK